MADGGYCPGLWTQVPKSTEAQHEQRVAAEQNPCQTATTIKHFPAGLEYPGSGWAGCLAHEGALLASSERRGQMESIYGLMGTSYS